MLSENDAREAENPIHKGMVYQAMMDAGKLTQEELAKEEEISQQTLQEYVSLRGLPEALRENTARAVNLGLKHYLQILRLKTPKEQVEMAEKAENVNGVWLRPFRNSRGFSRLFPTSCVDDS